MQNEVVLYRTAICLPSAGSVSPFLWTFDFETSVRTKQCMYHIVLTGVLRSGVLEKAEIVNGRQAAAADDDDDAYDVPDENCINQEKKKPNVEHW